MMNVFTLQVKSFLQKNAFHVQKHIARINTSIMDSSSIGKENQGLVFEDAPVEDSLHKPVMAEEVLKLMDPQNSHTIVDMTFGAGGHSRRILKAAPQASLYVLDRDRVAFEIAERLAEAHCNVRPMLGRFSELPGLLQDRGVTDAGVDCVLFDLGASSMQFDQADRGFRLSADGPLDMRMDTGRFPNQPTAADVVNTLDERDLYKIIKKYGEEKDARHIARTIVDARYAFGNITTTKELANIISSAFSEGTHRKDKLQRHSHVATKTFQALRIFVNNELNELKFGLQYAQTILKPGGKCIVISFHSLEDRLVKQSFKERHGLQTDKHYSTDNILRTDFKPIWENMEYFEPTENECSMNPRARSAKLRIAFKV